MLKKSRFYFIVLVTFLICLSYSFGQIDPRVVKEASGRELGQILGSISQSEIDDFLEALENLGRVAELGAEQIAPYIYELSDKGLSQLSAEQLEYEDSSGIRTINKIDSWVTTALKR